MGSGLEFDCAVLTLNEAGLSADALNLNRPSDDEPHSVSIALARSTSHVDVIVYRGLCPTGGYDINVEDVQFRSEEDEFTITVSLVDPGPDDFVTMMLTRPTKVVRLRIDELPAQYVSVRDVDGELKDRIEVSP